MKYCNRCIIPESRPNIEIDADSGTCNACHTHATKKEIDWNQRKEAFHSVIAEARSRSEGYDCVIPVSGGKDSTWQVTRCLEWDMKPLAVTWKTPARTQVGQQNLDNLVRLGVDHLEFQINPVVESKFMLACLEKKGDPAIPMHMAIFNIPRRIARCFRIPLIVWGENPAFEYGGTEEERRGFSMDAQWLRKYGVTQGTKAGDWVSEDLSARDLLPYFGPPLEDDGAETLGVFMGYYFPWDPKTSLEVASRNGFQSRREGPKVGYYNYADIDDDFISIHHYLKWYKFGFTRLFDNLSLEIRNERMSRDQAIAILREKGEQYPDEDIERFCQFVGITHRRFREIIERFRNPQVWTKRAERWEIDGFLVEDWEWR